MSDKKENTILIIGILILLVAISAVSYALWTITRVQTNPNEVMTGCFNITYTDESESINLTSAFPMTEEGGLRTRPYVFSIENTCSAPAAYWINLEVLEDNTLSESYIRVSLDKSRSTLISDLPSTNATINNAKAYFLKQGDLAAGEKVTYRLNMWMDENTPQTEENKTINSKIVISSIAGTLEEYADTSGANEPILNNGLIPVKWNGTNWIKADIHGEWYNYNEQQWANAVTVKETNRSSYTSAAAGTEIPMSEINTMWVWVPRYEYQTDNLTYVENGTIYNQYAGGSQTQPGGININFISKETTTASAGNFLIHPAFTFGTQELSGMWVAKFELSTGEMDCFATWADADACDTTSVIPTIEPNAKSWRGASTGTFFTTIKNQMNGSNGTTTYGITNSDTHLMKNMEWGAVAYLSQSKYGKYGNSSYMGINKEITINNCSGYVTGIGADSVNAYYSDATCTTNTYETVKGQSAASTGNIYGIYDMSGGAFDAVMATMKVKDLDEPAVGTNQSSHSGFSGKTSNGKYEIVGLYGSLKDIDSKYYDLYEYGTTHNDASALIRGHLGDATRETAGWYNDMVYFSGNSYPLMDRGGAYDYSTSSGAFDFCYISGNASPQHAARAVLVAQS